jgi:hypothetical protein
MSPQLSAARDDRSQLFGDASSVAVAYLHREKVLLAGDLVIYPLPYTPNGYLISTPEPVGDLWDFLLLCCAQS